MKTIVIYNSQMGFTKRYAEWITEAAGTYFGMSEWVTSLFRAGIKRKSSK